MMKNLIRCLKEPLPPAHEDWPQEQHSGFGDLGVASQVAVVVGVVGKLRPAD
jgi:hypothetical protein